MQRRKRQPDELAADLGISHVTISRWLSGAGFADTRSCLKLAQYSCVPVEEILSIAGYLPTAAEGSTTEWPEFREYARHKCPNELDEDLITLVEDLIERRRAKINGKQNCKLGK